MRFGDPRHAYVRKTSVKVRLPSEHSIEYTKHLSLAGEFSNLASLEGPNNY